MSNYFYVSPEQLTKDRAEFAQKGIARGRSMVAAVYEVGVLLVAEKPSASLNKISEIYDRIAFAGVGKYNEFDRLREAGIRWADGTGFTYSREDVDARALANYYAQHLGDMFSEGQKPLEVEILVAQLGNKIRPTKLYRIAYEGTISDEPRFAVLGGDAETIRVIALAIGQKAVEFPIIVGMHPRPVVMVRFSAVEQVAAAVGLRKAEHSAFKAIHAAFQRDEILRQGLVKFQVCRTGSAVVAHRPVVGTLFVINPLHEFRNDGVHVGVAFAMRVRRQVERHAVENNGEVGAMIQIEAAQKILVGFPAARVLRDDDPGNSFENLAAAQDRAVGQLRRSGGTLAR